jgi:hypothetical protein
MKPMLPQEHSNNANALPTTLSGNFTSAEVDALTDLRRNFFAHTEYLERVIDERRMEFARWLVEHHKLSDDLREQ